MREEQEKPPPQEELAMSLYFVFNQRPSSIQDASLFMVIMIRDSSKANV